MLRESNHGLAGILVSVFISVIVLAVPVCALADEPPITESTNPPAIQETPAELTPEVPPSDVTEAQPSPEGAPDVPNLPDLTGKVVVLDAGHGGREFGAVRAGIEEKDLTLEMTLRLKAALESAGARVVLTRSSDVDVSLKQRVAIANASGAEVFVSIHVNAMPQGVSAAKGVEVWYRTTKSERLGRVMLGTLTSTLQVAQRGLHTRNLYVVHHTTMPSILVETGFISNPDERAKLVTAEYQQKIAKAIVSGLDLYWSGAQGDRSIKPKHHSTWQVPRPQLRHRRRR